MANRHVYHPLFVLAGILFLSACNNSNPSTETEKAVKSAYVKSIELSRTQKDKSVVENEVIEAEDLANFKGLNYFPVDSTYRIQANLKRLPPLQVQFKTNTERSPDYFTFGILEFKIGDSTCSLIAYSSKIDASDGLFIPFKDASNNTETYGGGRYLEIPFRGETNTFELDFNQAFNPYCHYNHGYSCPIVPANNQLHVSILAGEKKFHD